MSDRPIIMSGESVRAIMAGIKTQFRQVMPKKSFGWWNACGLEVGDDGYPMVEDDYCIECRLPSPHEVGDTLWVRETWRPWSWREDHPIHIQYKADSAIGVCDVDDEDWYERIAVEATKACAKAGLPHDGEGYRWPDGKCPLPWRSPLFLPRAGSRLSLLVTEVRAQRVQDISDKDARAEGMESCTPYDQYRVLWDRINGKKHPYSSNPWVWAYTFEKQKRSER